MSTPAAFPLTGLLLEASGSSEDGVTAAWLGHVVRAAGKGGDFLAGDVSQINFFP